jgi:hypothetical protein
MLPTIDKTVAVAVTSTQAVHSITKPGIYLIQNVGADICNLRMYPAATGYTVDTNDFPLSPIGSGDMSAIEVIVTPNDKKTFPDGPNHLYHICAATKSTTLAVTRMTRDGS